MTAGYPDWQSYSSWRGTPIVSNPALALGAGGNSTGITPIPHWSGVTLRGVATNRNVVFILNFYADAGGVTLVERLSWCCPSGGQVTVNVPALGPYVEGFITNLGAAGGLCSFFLQPTNVATTSVQYMTNLTPQPLVGGVAVLAAASGANFLGTEVYEGEAYFMVETSSGNSYHGSLSYFDSVTQALVLLTRFTGAVLGQGGQFALALPPSIVNISITNDDAVGRTIDVFVHRAH